MAVELMPMPVLSFFDQNGLTIPFAKIFSYQAGTSTPLALYQDAAGATPHANPAIADAGGRLVAYLLIGQGYKINVQDANGVQIPNWPIDNIVAIPQGDPTLINGYSDTLAEMQTTHDPGGGTNPPESLAEEIASLRHMFKARPGVSNWYDMVQNKEKQGDVSTSGVDSNLAWPDAATSGYLFSFRVPYDYESGSIVFHLFRRVLAGSGTAIMPYNIQRVRNATAITTISSGNIDYAPGNANSNETLLSIAAGTFAIGDMLRLSISRLGADAGDTNAGAIAYDGHYFSYTGYISR